MAAEFVGDVGENPSADGAPAFDTVWGPIASDVGRKVGALDGCASVLVRPADRGVCEEMCRLVCATFPTEILPTYGDDVNSLKARLSKCEYLDDIHVLQGGKGPRRVRLNGTDYPQPRRVTFSEEVSEASVPHPASEGYVWRYAYTPLWKIAI